MENKNIEKNEIRLLLDNGFQITIKTKAERRKFFFWRKKEFICKILDFKEPTLAVLDLVTEKFLNLNIFDTKKEEPAHVHIRNANKTVKENAEKMAEIIAIFALGEDCFLYNGTRYLYQKKEVEKLKNIIFHTLQPHELENIISQLTALSNLPDFMVSTRLTGANRTTAPAALVE